MLRRRVWIAALVAVIAGVAAVVYLRRDQTLLELHSATIGEAVGREVRLRGVKNESNSVLLRASDGASYILVNEIPQHIPAGNEVLVTGRITLVSMAASEPRLLKLGNQTITDLGTKPAPPAAPPTPGDNRVPITIRVTAKQWSWRFEYPNGRVSNELHLPKGWPVRFDVMSEDVVHAMHIRLPKAKHVGVAAVPGGHVNSIAMTAPEVERGRLLCGEYCGAGHSQCGADVIVQGVPEFELWLTSLPATAPTTSATTRPVQ
jgi:heme/copper-type cytochrome/quinol oxidase subunit 2